ncbi:MULTISPECIES: hypothetical protein [unclassified Clostridium]|uniref:MmyB family transcriptional regulator n=1 Tax=unclassified Clostridium TaxID=2614128 RepID=UPI0002986522|nr:MULTISPECIES: hypothetical protein [unclassified Clostridium]EKQ54455.1 MAG: hypothetical protein A370_03279 [Clostridium sp. Maddingley MBC34-26]
MLDEQERIYIYDLVRQVPPADIPPLQRSVSPMLQHVLDNLILSPSFIMDTKWNIISWNKAASVVFCDFNKIDESQRNMVWIMFNHDDYKKLFIDWEFHARGMLARFRSTTVKYIDNPWFSKFIEDIKKRSKEFSLWWPEHDVQKKNEFYKKLEHPIVGTMIFEFSSFDVSDNSNLNLIVYTPFSGTDTDIKVKELLEK